MTPAWATKLMEEVRQKWEALPPSLLKDSKAGYAVFYCPVPDNTPLLILGLNPGGGPKDTEHQGIIPEEHEYLSCNYSIACKTRKLFEQSGYLWLLKKSVKSNLLFFRTKDKDSWNRVPKCLRKELTKFCDTHVQEIVRQLRPRVILLEGVQTFDQFRARIFPMHGEESSTRRLGTRRIYVSTRSSPGILVIGILHLSGCRPRASTAEMALISENLKTDLVSVGLMPQAQSVP
jgi:hypothetical protein